LLGLDSRAGERLGNALGQEKREEKTKTRGKREQQGSGGKEKRGIGPVAETEIGRRRGKETEKKGVEPESAGGVAEKTAPANSDSIVVNTVAMKLGKRKEKIAGKGKKGMNLSLIGE